MRLVARAEDFVDAREPALRIGDRVHLNSGGPDCLIVERSAHEATIAWRDGDRACEATLPVGCVHRIR
jgi:uncharacterized protein YodC (DUF2158 family)